MIYVFEGIDGASIVYDGSTLTQEQKNKAIAVESLPQKETPEGKIAVLRAKKSTNEVWWEHVDASTNEIDELRNDLNDAVMELSMLIAMGGNA